MNEDFVPFELAKKLKEKGFRYNKNNLLDRLCMENQINHPPISQVLNWLRKDKKIHIEIALGRNGWYFEIVQYEYYEDENEYDCKLITTSVIYDFYEQAALAGIEYVIDNNLI